MRLVRFILTLALVVPLWIVSVSETGAVGVWSPLAPPKVARTSYSLTQLTDGTILTVGGDVGEPRRSVATVERYDPATDTWRAAAPLTIPRAYHAATLLPDGRVLVVGGQAHDGNYGSTYPTATELYDPVVDRWTAGPPLPDGSVSILMVNLRDGRVLIIGDGSMERYDPLTGRLVSVAVPRTEHDGGTATVLSDGTVLLVGGLAFCDCNDTKIPSRPTTKAERYDPQRDIWKSVAPMQTPRFNFVATALADGQALVLGGDPGVARLAERYDPTTDRWSATGPKTTRATSTLTLLPNGQVLATGGGGTEVYEPGTDRWRQIAPVRSGVSSYARATLLADGSLLIVDVEETLRYSDVATPPGLCFAETGHCISGPFRDYWLAHGGLAINGLPLTDERVEGVSNDDYPVQYFERARFEFHYRYVAGPSDPIRDVVLLGQVGRQIHPLEPGVAPQAGATYFEATGHNLAEPFRAYWQVQGDLAQFGYPLGEARTERLEDGRNYLVQYFERARFEYHPENDAANRVQLGQLGRRALAEYERGQK